MSPKGYKPILRNASEHIANPNDPVTATKLPFSLIRGSSEEQIQLKSPLNFRLRSSLRIFEANGSPSVFQIERTSIFVESSRFAEPTDEMSLG